MRRLSVEEIIYMHSEFVKAAGGSDGIRDNGLLESAVNAPFHSFGGYDVYPAMFYRLASSEITFDELVIWIRDHEHNP